MKGARKRARECTEETVDNRARKRERERKEAEGRRGEREKDGEK